VERRLIGSGCPLGWLRDGCIRWVEIVEEKKGSFGVNVGHPIVTNGDFVLWCSYNLP